MAPALPVSCTLTASPEQPWHQHCRSFYQLLLKRTAASLVQGYVTTIGRSKLYVTEQLT
jgi:hypothetical protein